MFSRAELKNGAKDQLRGKWLLAVLVFICYSVILQLINIDLTNSMEGSMLGISLNIVGLLVFGSMKLVCADLL
ncbi:putative membrane protein [[Clostridium] sordellii ATCC 9714]|nr:putative membrane protein [[Clostridium] sordellii ATCC 9714] [Paeniclostridium sordellii ATCC 9714]